MAVLFGKFTNRCRQLSIAKCARNVKVISEFTLPYFQSHLWPKAFKISIIKSFTD